MSDLFGRVQRCPAALHAPPFHALLTQLGIPHRLSEVKGADHVYKDIVSGLGDEGFAFWRQSFRASSP